MTIIIEKQKAILCVYMLFTKDSDILMSRRINKGYMNNHYQVLTGHMDKTVQDGRNINEKATTAVIRESLEEGGVTVKEEDIEHILTQLKPSDDVPESRVCLYFKINKWTGDLVNLEPEMADNFGFYALDKLPQPLMPELASAFKAIKEKRSFDQYGYN